MPRFVILIGGLVALVPAFVDALLLDEFKYKGWFAAVFLISVISLALASLAGHLTASQTGLATIAGGLGLALCAIGAGQLLALILVNSGVADFFRGRMEGIAGRESDMLAYQAIFAVPSMMVGGFLLAKVLPFLGMNRIVSSPKQ